MADTAKVILIEGNPHNKIPRWINCSLQNFRQ